MNAPWFIRRTNQDYNGKAYTLFELINRDTGECKAIQGVYDRRLFAPGSMVKLQARLNTSSVLDRVL